MAAETIPALDLSAFDSAFFAGYEQQLADVNMHEQATIALEGILTVKNPDDTDKSYEQIRDETRAFLASDWVRNDEALLNQLTAQFAHACMGHVHGSELARDEVLGTAFERGIKNILGERDHDHDRSSDEEDDDDDEPRGTHRRRRFGRWLLSRLSRRH